ncbi:MAG: hypothetical protein KatS3mg113_0804 [Planctomycetaceae bacterium]|nr:MAG: hypothetical protein KatS3mg113_0804 [Planctomycetaceae bacterium]
MLTQDIILDLYRSSLKDLVAHVQPIPEEAMTQQPAGQVNHPAWMLSHLANAAAFIAFLLDEPCADVSAEDMKHYGPGSRDVAVHLRQLSPARLRNVSRTAGDSPALSHRRLAMPKRSVGA